VARIVARENARREGYDPTLVVRHQPPEPRRDKEKERPPEYPGWRPREKQCRHCEEPFMPNAPAQAYCSPACHAIAGRAQRRITDKGKRERRKARELAARNGKPRTRTCRLPGCDKEFVPPFPRSAYCSQKCKAEALRLSNNAYQRRRHRRPSEQTQEAMLELEELEGRLHGAELDPLQREYVVMLWRRINEDINAPEFVYSRLEMILGLSDGPQTRPVVPACA
jgi:hypothetical protein